MTSCIIPLAVLAGLVWGGYFACRFGPLWIPVGAVVGGVLSIPITGLLILLFAGIAAMGERFVSIFQKRR